jgi:hypothetical protein
MKKQLLLASFLYIGLTATAQNAADRDVDFNMTYSTRGNLLEYKFFKNGKLDVIFKDSKKVQSKIIIILISVLRNELFGLVGIGVV